MFNKTLQTVVYPPSDLYFCHSYQPLYLPPAATRLLGLLASLSITLNKTLQTVVYPKPPRICKSNLRLLCLYLSALLIRGD